MATQMRPPHNNAQATSNGNLYKPGLSGLALVNDADVSLLIAFGWTALTARMLAPSETLGLSVGQNNYIVGNDGAFFADPKDVVQLVAKAANR